VKVWVIEIMKSANWRQERHSEAKPKLVLSVTKELRDPSPSLCSGLKAHSLRVTSSCHFAICILIFAIVVKGLPYFRLYIAAPLYKDINNCLVEKVGLFQKRRVNSTFIEIFPFL